MRHSNFRWLILFIFLISIVILTSFINFTKDNNLNLKPITIDNGEEKINWEHYTTIDVELSESYKIIKSGIYHFTGELNNGLISVDTTKNDVIKIILDNVTIKNNSGPTISCSEGDDLVIELVGENSLEDGATYDASLDEDIKGVIYSKADLTFEGEGTLNIIAKHEDGIVSKDSLKFKSGNYNITSADDAIRGKDSVYILNGNFDLESTGDAIHSNNIVGIVDGRIKIVSGDDGIHANRLLNIDGGIINIEKGYEGLEAQVVTINDGNISILTSDDGINAGGGADESSINRVGASLFDADEKCSININGGTIYINSSGDGIDSNGSLNINNGKVVIDGPTSDGNGALDSGITITMNGGEVVAVGSSRMAENLGMSSTVYNISIYFQTVMPAKTKIEIKDSNEKTVLEHTSAKSFSHLSAGSEELIPAETYTIYVNDEEYDKFTITNIVTTVNNSYDIMKQRR